MFIIHGKNKTFIDIFEPLFYKCPNCQEENTTQVFIYSVYHHVFWIPIFPGNKEVTAKCFNCGSTRTKDRFGPKLTDHLNENIKKYKHPIITWSFTILLGLIILAMILGMT